MKMENRLTFEVKVELEVKLNSITSDEKEEVKEYMDVEEGEEGYEGQLSYWVGRMRWDKLVEKLGKDVNVELMEVYGEEL
jgi:hypothetical protein